MDIDSDSEEGQDKTQKQMSLGVGRDAVEDSLRQKIYVEQFPRRTAGAPIPKAGSEGVDVPHGLYQSNPYCPFVSEIDWKVAKWAKLRGQGSTAVSDLLGIPGVSIPGGMTFESAHLWTASQCA